MIKIELQGTMIDSDVSFLTVFSQECNISQPLTGFVEFSDYLSLFQENVEIYWYGAEGAKSIKVRASDIPLSELPEGGSNMMREIVLDLIWKEVSLLEKVQTLLEQYPQVTLILL